MSRGVLLILGAVLAGALLRLPHPAVRPMHTDEAVHAVKFGALLEHGEYRYDPHEYHGPTLNYLTLLPAWSAGVHRTADLTEAHLRIVPIVAGILLIALFLLVRHDPGMAWAAVFAALSPSLVFYSRYYIQEMLLVGGTVALAFALYRFLRDGGAGWAVAAGCAAGLMVATKETSIITFSVLGVALLVLTGVRRQQGWPGGFPHVRPLLAAAGAALLVIVVFFSSFGRNPQGVADAFSILPVYLERAGGDGEHAHPWYTYLRILAGSWINGMPVGSEGVLLLFGCAGAIRILRESRTIGDPAAAFRTGTLIFTVVLFVLLSVIPYKTPWVMLTCVPGCAVMAGYGMAWFTGWGRIPGVVRAAVPVAVLFFSAWQAYTASFPSADDPENPYTYAQPRVDVVEAGDAVLDAARAAGRPVTVYVFYEEDAYWPMPWYLRSLPNTGWWSTVPASLPGADILLVSPGLEQAVLAALHRGSPPGAQDLYVPLFSRVLTVRPGKELRGYTTLALWERMVAGEVER